MVRKQNDDLLIEDELAAAFLSDDDLTSPQAPTTGMPPQQAAAPTTGPVPTQTPGVPAMNTMDNGDWQDGEEELPGTLAVDVYETEERLVIKARTAGVNKEDLDVSISDGILTISGTLSSGDDSQAINWHIQECYWGEFSRTIALPVAVKEDEVEAVLKDGVLTISFTKVKQEQAKKIQIL